jgi:hypothetical protein
MKYLHLNVQRCVGAIFGMSTVCLAVTGCGEPDIKSMQPTVSKLAAEVLLVDNPQNWKASDLMNAASEAGVDTFVQNVKMQDVIKTLGDVVENRHIGLCAVIYDGSIPTSVLTFATQNSNVKFEFISDGTNHVQGSNVQNVYVDPSMAGFMLGFGTGNLAAGMGQYTVGWLTSPSAAPIAKQEIEATLGGFYQADPKANIIPVAMNNPGVMLPHILISDHALSSTELQAVSQSGSVVFSLVKVSAGPEFAAWPSFIDQSAVMQDFSMFANSTWKPGDRPIEQPQCVSINVHVLPQNVSQNIQTEEQVVAGDPAVVQGAYTSMPDALKSAYGPIVSLGS